MIKARIRWCSSRLENILTLGKLLRLWFCFLLHSILFFISQTSYRRTYKIISSYELARPLMGTIFLVYILGKWLPLESELESFPIFFSSSIALLSSLLSCNFYLLDLKTISIVDILEMT